MNNWRQKPPTQAKCKDILKAIRDVTSEYSEERHEFVNLFIEDPLLGPSSVDKYAGKLSMQSCYLIEWLRNTPHQELQDASDTLWFNKVYNRFPP